MIQPANAASPYVALFVKGSVVATPFEAPDAGYYVLVNMEEQADQATRDASGTGDAGGDAKSGQWTAEAA